METLSVIAVTALKDHPYGGIQRKAGDVYTCESRFLQVLELTGVVRRLEPEEADKSVRRQYRRRDMVPEQ